MGHTAVRVIAGARCCQGDYWGALLRVISGGTLLPLAPGNCCSVAFIAVLSSTKGCVTAPNSTEALAPPPCHVNKPVALLQVLETSPKCCCWSEVTVPCNFTGMLGNESLVISPCRAHTSCVYTWAFEQVWLLHGGRLQQPPQAGPPQLCRLYQASGRVCVQFLASHQGGNRLWSLCRDKVLLVCCPCVCMRAGVRACVSCTS